MDKFKKEEFDKNLTVFKKVLGGQSPTLNVGLLDPGKKVKQRSNN